VLTQHKTWYDVDMAKPIKVLGISGDVTDCDCCGKQDLKRTVCVLDTEEEAIRFLGTTCAAKAINTRNGNFYTTSSDVVKFAGRAVATMQAVAKQEANKRLVAA